jgi:hypothetical protein
MQELQTPEDPVAATARLSRFCPYLIVPTLELTRIGIHVSPAFFANRVWCARGVPDDAAAGTYMYP